LSYGCIFVVGGLLALGAGFSLNWVLSECNSVRQVACTHKCADQSQPHIQQWMSEELHGDNPTSGRSAEYARGAALPFARSHFADQSASRLIVDLREKQLLPIGRLVLDRPD